MKIEVIYNPYFRQPIVEDPTSETDDESSQHQQNNQPQQRPTVPKDKCYHNLPNQTVNQTNSTLTPGASMAQIALVDSRLQVPKNVEASQNILVCDCAKKQHRTNGRKRRSNDQPPVCSVDTYPQNWEGNRQPRSLQYSVAANAISHHGQSNNNMEISEVN